MPIAIPSPASRIPEVRDSLAFADLLTRLHERRYTGPVLIHFFSGSPTACELVQEPIRFRLNSGAGVDSGK